MLRDDMKLISVDDHVIEHPRVWQDRLPEKYRDAGPRIVETDDELIWRQEGASNAAEDDARASKTSVHRSTKTGREAWQWEGRLYPNMGLGVAVGRDKDDWSVDPVRYDEMPRGAYDPAARIKDMEIDGVHAQMCFPTFPKFSGTILLDAEDKTLGLLCVQAYNDFMIDEWCGYDPSRQIPLVLVPLWDPAEAAAEIERTAAKGARAVSFPESPGKLGLPSFHSGEWDPFFAAAQDAEMPVCMHIGTSGELPRNSDDSPLAVSISLVGCNAMSAMADLLFSDVFSKFPRLKVAFSEGGIGWMPYLLERLDYTYDRQNAEHVGIQSQAKPSELFAKHVWGCFVDDPFGIKVRHSIGVDRIMWEGDYPHSDCNWPNARKLLAEDLLDVPDLEAHRMVELNARELFRFDG